MGFSGGVKETGGKASEVRSTWLPDNFTTFEYGATPRRCNGYTAVWRFLNRRPTKANAMVAIKVTIAVTPKKAPGESTVSNNLANQMLMKFASVFVTKKHAVIKPFIFLGAAV